MSFLGNAVKFVGKTVSNYIHPSSSANGQTTVSSPASSAWSYDNNKSANENIYDYALSTGSTSAMESFLNNKYSQEMSDSSIQRAIADAEKAGISKYQLFQSGNAGASTPVASSGISTSEENSKDRSQALSVAYLNFLAKITSSALNSAGKVAASSITTTAK